MITTMRDWLRQVLPHAGPAEAQTTASALQRRRFVTVIVIACGSVVLGLSLRIQPGSALFYPATIALALIWLLGALVSGPLHLGRVVWRDRLRRPVLSPIVIGLVLATAFIVGALIVREIPVLEEQVKYVTEHADEGSLTLLVLITALNGVAEEMFFRGAVYASLTRHPVLVSTVAYALATLATGNVMLAFAALVLGFVVGLERRTSGGILAPMLTHVTWSLAMLLALPALFD